jgi:hypothetical protein
MDRVKIIETSVNEPVANRYHYSKAPSRCTIITFLLGVTSRLVFCTSEVPEMIAKHSVVSQSLLTSSSVLTPKKKKH